MKRNMVIWSLLLLAPCGCSSMNNTEKDATGGAVAGAAAGALLTRGNPVGAVIGGLFGTAVGASIGSDQDRRDQRQAYVQAQTNAAVAQQARTQMSLTDIVQMAQQGQSDSIIIGQINATNSAFQLTPDDVNYLHQQRVSDAVISYMQSRRSVVVVPGPAVVYDRGPYWGPPPPPPIGVGVIIR